MSRAKKTAIVVAMLFAGSAAVGALLLAPPAPGISRANFDQIELGMTQSEVELLFDGPPRIENLQLVHVGGLRPLGMPREIWASDAGVAYVTFDKEHKVWHTYWSSNETFFQRTWRRVSVWRR